MSPHPHVPSSDYQLLFQISFYVTSSRKLFDLHPALLKVPLQLAPRTIPITAPIHCILNVFLLCWIFVLLYVEGGYIRIIWGAPSNCTPKTHLLSTFPIGHEYALSWKSWHKEHLVLMAMGCVPQVCYGGRKVENCFTRLAVPQGR